MYGFDGLFLKSDLEFFGEPGYLWLIALLVVNQRKVFAESIGILLRS